MSSKPRQHGEIDCGRARDLLALLPGSELPGDLDRPVREHVAGCVSCRRELGQFVGARRALRTLAPGALRPPEAAFFAELRSDTLAAVQAAPVPARRTASALMTAAALFLLGVYGVSIWPRSSRVEDLPVLAPTPRGSSDGRIREVGHYSDYYGLLGRYEISNRPFDRRLTLDPTTLDPTTLDPAAPEASTGPGPALATDPVSARDARSDRR